MHARTSGWPTTSPRTSRTRSASADASWRGSTGASDGPAHHAGPSPPICDEDELLGIASVDPKVPFDPRDVIARVVDGSDFDEFKPLYGTSLVTGWASIHGYPSASSPTHGACCSARRREGRPVHPAGQPDRHATGLPAEHHRLHGRRRVRAGRHHQGRRQDDQRRRQQHGAPHVTITMARPTAPATTACAGGPSSPASCSAGPTQSRR
jgi:hypothetical protein